MSRTLLLHRVIVSSTSSRARFRASALSASWAHSARRGMSSRVASRSVNVHLARAFRASTFATPRARRDGVGDAERGGAFRAFVSARGGAPRRLDRGHRHRFPPVRDERAIHVPQPARVSRRAPLRVPSRLRAHRPVFFHRGIARGREISSLSMEPLSDADDPALAHGNLGLVATYFEIPGDEFPALAAREAEFNLVAAHPAHPETGERLPHAVLCAASSDEEYVERYCVAAEDRTDDDCGCVACDLRRHGEPRVWYPLARSAEDDAAPRDLSVSNVRQALRPRRAVPGRGRRGEFLGPHVPRRQANHAEDVPGV